MRYTGLFIALWIATSCAWIPTSLAQSERGGRRTAWTSWELPQAGWTRAELEKVPERKLEVKQIDDKVRRTLDRADPSLLDQKYAATVKLDLAQWETRSDRQPLPSLIPFAEGVENAGSFKDIFRHTSSQSVNSFGVILNRRAKNFEWGGQREAAATLLNSMLELVPPKRLSTEQVEFLKAGDTHSRLEQVSNEDGVRVAYRLVCQVYGATPEACVRNIETLLTVLDEGGSRPVRLLLADERTRRAEQFAQLLQERAELERQYADVESRLKNDVDLTPELMIGLKQQQLNLEVELVGTQAKIEAAQKLLAGPVDKDARAAVTAAKVEAELSLASIEARRTKLNELIGSVKDKAELAKKRTALSGDLSELALRASQASFRIVGLDIAIAHYAPFPVVDNQVIVQPVDWASPIRRM